MKGIIDFITAHQFTAGLCIFVAIVILFFLFKRFIKIVLLIILFIMVLIGYAYFKEANRMPKSMHEVLQKTKEETHKIAEKGRDIYEGVMSIFEMRRKPVTDYIDKITEQDRQAAMKNKRSPDDHAMKDVQETQKQGLKRESPSE